MAEPIPNLKLSFDTEGGLFHFRAAGVITDGDRVLLHRAETDDFWSLPGGRVHFGESAQDAVRREMREEIGVEVQWGRLLWVAEVFFPGVFPSGGPLGHELGFYYLLSLPSDCAYLHQTEPFEGDEEGLKLIFQWFPREEAAHLNLYPIFLREKLAHLPETVEHILAIE